MNNNVHENSPNVRPLYRGTQIVWYIFYAIEVILLFRFVLKLLGANVGAPFTAFVYNISYIFVAPFLAVVGSPRVAGSVLEWSTLIAMVVYWVLVWGIIRLFFIGKPVSQGEARYKLEKQDPDNTM